VHSIHWRRSTYESALVRFGVLSLIIDKISMPLAAGSLALYLFLAAVILATATAHRRRQYGLLLMSGITPGDLGYIVAFQIVLSCIVGGIAGYVVYLATASTINMLLADSGIVADARLIIGLDVPAFLPSLSGLAVATLWSGMTLLAVGVGTMILRFQGITNAAAPITLVKS
jgi:ABC-type antimicrobial peptide transport system permease subunit